MKLQSMYLGPEDQHSDIEKTLTNKFKNKEMFFNFKKFEDKNFLIKTVANDLNNGLIIAWHQGQMEFGPRALGNRSILGNPCVKNIKEIINSKIKNREEFRPFAPSVLEEFADQYFELNNSLDYRFMNIICDTKKKKRNLIPGVVNIDNTSRPQLVSDKDNKTYYCLIKEFYKLSKVPILLNTSLNIQEPICCTSEDTVNTYLNSGIDVMVIGNFYIKRKKNTDD
jgi:carbamoyltransferase